jgi:hypothetical protein
MIRGFCVLAGGWFLSSIALFGQAAGGQVPVIPGVNGTIALQGNVDKIYADVNAVVVTTIDGAHHLIHVTKGTQVHGREPQLEHLQPGTAVVVHYSHKGAEKTAEEIDDIGPGGLKHAEGVVTRVDIFRKRIQVKFADGTMETLRLTHHAAGESGSHAPDGHRVIVYYSDDSGQKVAHYFKRVLP